MAESLASRSAFSCLLVAVGNGRGVTAIDRDGLGLATIAVRKGSRNALSQRIRDEFRIELPGGPTRAAAGEVAFAGIAPGSWLAMRDQGGNAFAASLAQSTAGLASVTDQSDGYAVLRLTGPMVRAALAKLLPIDLHPRAFQVGAVASTVASHMGVTVWRLPDTGGAAVFELAVFRSLAESFWHALAEGAAEFGLAVGRPC
ncbi:MAG TPA: sarcosine oxidase subunit gamma family protein [Steroidobacteraceae bacterium]|jgi:sarcosine oxidase subunit gamma|nr:sarcosine oxidase subunit gamma family protein [Steroidobacteraceae bacterium]